MKLFFKYCLLLLYASIRVDHILATVYSNWFPILTECRLLQEILERVPPGRRPRSYWRPGPETGPEVIGKAFRVTGPPRTYGPLTVVVIVPHQISVLITPDRGQENCSPANLDQLVNLKKLTEIYFWFGYFYLDC